MPEGQISGCGLVGHLGPHIVYIDVGEGKHVQSFPVHENLLAVRCPALDAIKIRGTGRTSISLRKEDAQTIEHFLSWLYQNNLDCIKKDSFAFDFLTDVYTFAITYKIAELADNAIDNLIYFHSLKSDWLPLMNLIDTWAETPQGCKLELYIATVIAYRIAHSRNNSFDDVEDVDVTEHLGKYVLLCTQVLSIMMKCGTSGEPITVRDPSSYPRCDYHSHEPDKPCPYAERR